MKNVGGNPEGVLISAGGRSVALNVICMSVVLVVYCGLVQLGFVRMVSGA